MASVRNNYQKTLYKRISISDARENKEYASLVENIFLQVAVLTMQRQFREKRGLTYSGKPAKLLTGPLTRHFIKEPKDDKFLEHVNKIQAGKFLELDYNDPEFVRNIYKACRLKYITTDQLASVTLWRDGISLFRSGESESKLDMRNIRQFSFEEKGCYDPANIEYITTEKLGKFYQDLKDIPVSEKQYLVIDFLPEHEILLLLHLVVNYRRLHSKSFKSTLQNMFLKFISIYEMSTSYSEELNSAILSLDEKACLTLIDFLSIMLSRDCPEVKYDFKTGNLDMPPRISDFYYSMNLFAELIRHLETQIPHLIMASKTIDSENSLFSLILPTARMLKELQKAIHNEDTAYPVYTVGKFSLRHMVKILYQSENLRPIELVHPDVQHEEKPHSIPTTGFMVTWHDFFHIWRNGSNMYKNLFRHLIQSISIYKDIDMSTAIFSLVDMDSHYGGAIRNVSQDPSWLREILKIGFVAHFLKQKAAKDFWLQTEKYDHNLLIIVDMIINREQWKIHLEAYPEDFFMRKKTFPENVPLDSFDNFQTTIAKMRQFILEHPKSNSYESVLFYVLSYRFKEDLALLDLINQLDNIGLDKFFKWSPNDGIFISHPILLTNEKLFTENLTPAELGFHLKNILAYEKSNIAVLPSASSNKHALFARKYRMSHLPLPSALSVPKELRIPEEKDFVPHLWIHY